MKKKLFIIAICIGIFITITYYLSLPDYHIFNSMSFSTDSSRDTEMNVVIYHYWKIDQIYMDIEKEHNTINGTPSSLTINLYLSEFFLKRGYKPFSSTTIKY